MARIVSTHSFRGGTGKSNTTANLAVLVARAGNRVAVVDTDIQSPGIHVIFQLDESRIRHTLNDFLWGRSGIEQAACDVSTTALEGGGDGDRSRLFVVPASIKSGDIGRVLEEGYDVALLNDGFEQLATALELDYLFIDTHPGVNQETLLSIAVSDILVLVLRPDSQDFQGTAVTLELARRLDVENILLVVNKIPPGMDRDLLRRKIETAYDIAVGAMLPLNHEIVHLGSAGIFANRYPDHPLTDGLRSLASRILE